MKIRACSLTPYLLASFANDGILFPVEAAFSVYLPDSRLQDS